MYQPIDQVKNRYKTENATEGSRLRCEVCSGISPFILSAIHIPLV